MWKLDDEVPAESFRSGQRLGDALKTPVVGIGAGGHAKVVIEILQLQSQFCLVGLLDAKAELHGQSVHGVPVLGNDRYVQELIRQGVLHFFMGIGGTGNVLPRQRLYEMASGSGMLPVDAIHTQAIVSPSSKLGPGATICAGAVVGVDVEGGRDVLVNTGAIIEHDCQIGDHVHVATGAKLASTVHVGSGTHIGAGATVRQCIRVGSHAVVGAGAVVVKDVPDGAIVAGVPAKVLREVK